MNEVNRRMEAKPREADGSSGQKTSHFVQRKAASLRDWEAIKENVANEIQEPAAPTEPILQGRFILCLRKSPDKRIRIIPLFAQLQAARQLLLPPS